MFLLQVPVPPDPSYWWEPWAAPELVSLSVGVATLAAAALIAWRQFVIMRDQTKMMVKQTEMATEQTESTKRQEALAVKLAAITEKQDRLMDEQLRKQEELDLTVVQGDMLMRWQFRVRNSGQKAAAGFYWQIRLAKKNSDLIEIVPSDNGKLESAREFDHQRVPFVCWSGYFEKPTYPGCEVTCAYIRGNTNNINKFEQDVYIMWNVSSESGIFPRSQDFGVLFFKPLGDTKEYLAKYAKTKSDKGS